ncbi:MAG: leucine-rich repeat domain-containing protein [Sedimentisphaerales bacterium]|nr:leucine-rich repeat domain-containing protein [Sedimentisphaerales bacterium]
MKKYGYYFLALMVLGSSGVCFSQDSMPYWDAEIGYRYPGDPKFLMRYREIVKPETGAYSILHAYSAETSKKDPCFSSLASEEWEALLKLNGDIEGQLFFEMMSPIMLQMSETKDEQGFCYIESLCICMQEELEAYHPFLWGEYHDVSEVSSYDAKEYKGLASLTHFKQLKNLELFPCSIERFDVHQNLPVLKSLEYIGLPIDSNDATVDILLSLDRLQFINASGTLITGAHFEELAKLPNLEILDLRYTRLAENAISKLKNAKNLKTLLLTGAEITDKHLEGIEDLKGLQNLALTKTKITDSALKRIEQLPNLRYVTLGQTQITSPNLQALQSRKPNLTISLNPVIGWGEYQVKSSYRQAVLYGDVDAQIDIFHRYYNMFRLSGNKRYSEEQYKKVLSRPSPLQECYDPIELLKWSYIILHPRKSVQEVEQLKIIIPRANEAKEVLDKRLHVGEIAEARRRAELALSLINDYKLIPKNKFEYLPVYQTDFSSIDVSDRGKSQ